MTAFAAYPIHSQIASSATWNQTGHPDFLHPSPALSPNHFDAWQSCMETDTRHSSHENQGSNYQLSSRAINTYGERGLLKRGIDLNTHAAVYMRGSEPAPNDPTRVPGLPPIMINPYSPREQLHSKSYLNFGKVFTVDHNIKVKPVGHVSEESMRTFRRAWRRSVDLNENDEYNDFEPRDSDTTNSYR
ncbi:hypothetical protein McanCB21832_005218 [Microsporum canis]